MSKNDIVKFVKGFKDIIKNNPELYNQLLSMLKKLDKSAQLSVIGLIREIDNELADRLMNDLFPEVKKKKSFNQIIVYAIGSALISVLVIGGLIWIRRRRRG